MDQVPFGRGVGLTPMPSHTVTPPRIAECPVQLEAVLTESHGLEAGDPERAGKLLALEVRVIRVHLDDSVRMAGHQDRVDPERWRPLIMSFCQFFGLGEMVHPSRLAEIPESAYRAAGRLVARRRPAAVPGPELPPAIPNHFPAGSPAGISMEVSS